MLKTVPLLVLLVLVNCEREDKNNLESAIKSIFGSSVGNATEGSLVDKKAPSTFETSLNSDHNGKEDLICIMEDDTVGQCVPYNLCDNNKTFVDDDVDVIYEYDTISTEFNRHISDKNLCAYGMVCCVPRGVQLPDNQSPSEQKSRNDAIDAIMRGIFRQPDRDVTGKPPVAKNKPSTPASSINSENGEEESCTSADGSVGKCVPYFFCDSNSNDIGVGGKSCSAYIEVCCLSRDVRKNEKVTEPPPVATINDEILQAIFGSPRRKETGDSHVDNGKPSTSVPSINSKSDDKKVSCTMEDGTVGQCVKYFFCDENNTIVDDGTSVIYGNSSTSDTSEGGGMCSHYMDVCCLPRAKVTEPPPRSAKKGCGWRNPNGVDLRTIGETAEKAKLGEFPWMVVVIGQERELGGPELNVYLCGGSLIHPDVVLTLAHCVADAGALRIRAGEWDVYNTREVYPFQERDVASVELHTDFNKSNLYDAALLFLSDPVNLAPNVGVVCLPPPRARPYTGAQCFATGWGKDKYGMEGHYQNVLKKIEVTVIRQETCQTALRGTHFGRFFQLHSSFVCASGDKRQGTCYGDEGSPLSCPISFEEPRYMQSGIVAWGIGCGEYRIPGVYVDVSMVREWIDEKLILKGLDPRIADF